LAISLFVAARHAESNGACQALLALAFFMTTIAVMLAVFSRRERPPALAGMEEPLVDDVENAAALQLPPSQEDMEQQQ